MAKTTRINDYLDQHQSRFLEQLKEWLAIPSISTLPEHRKDVQNAANWAMNRLAALDFPEARIITTNNHPLVYAEWLAHDNKPTLLIYGHYDVQPIDPIEKWASSPFKPTIRSDAIYARGASDDKGQVMLVLAALEALIAVNTIPPVNIKILLEGEEEAGGASIAKFVQDNPESLSADLVLICDTHMVHPTQPSIITGLRGILYTEIEVAGASTDLHSGSYGGIAPNPIHALCVLLNRLKGEDGVIQIPELEAAVPIPSASEKLFWQQDPLNMEQALLREMGVKEFVGEKNYPPMERIGLRPTLEIHGIRGGFTGEGAKTVIPAKALAKISMRLPPNLDPNEVFPWLEKAVQQHMVPGYSYQLTNLHAGKGFFIDAENHYVNTASQTLESVYGKKPIFMREGGSIPIASLFDEILRTPVVLMGFGLPDDKIHAPNEKFSLFQFEKGMKTVAEFLIRLADT